MSFWKLDHPSDSIAVIDQINGQMYSYGELQELVCNLKNLLNSSMHKTLGFVICKNTLPSLIGYLAGLCSNNTVCLLSNELEKKLFVNLILKYDPDWMWVPDDAIFYEFTGYEPVIKLHGFVLLFSRAKIRKDTLIHQDVAVLLSTSGTTGSPKMVRLSYDNIQSNAVSIVKYLNITSEDKPITTLPMQYSYGLSVINSHLTAGATLLLTESGVMSKDFWQFFKANEGTSFAGVPYIYQILYRLRFGEMDLPSLKAITQAGGRLDDRLQKYFVEVSKQKNIRFFVMYGQTEATARISYIPPDRISQKIGSIGVAIPGGELELDGEQQLIYKGPNVMMGYAESRSDLIKGDLLFGRLETGDLAKKDEENFYYIVGRKKRFIKLFGLRINLDEVEQILSDKCGQSCYCVGDDNCMKVFIIDQAISLVVKKTLTEVFHLHASSYKISVISSIPRLSTGKVDYKALQEWSV